MRRGNLTAVSTSEDPRSRLLALARDSMEREGDVTRAAAKLMQAVNASPELRDALLAPWEEHAARELIRSRMHGARRKAWVRPEAPDARVHRLANAVGAALLDFRLPSGARLGDAGLEELTAAATLYQGQARDMAWKGRWLAACAARVEAAGAGRVSDALSDADLAALREETRE